MYRLPRDHYSRAAYHESAVACSLLIDRKLCARLTIGAHHVYDPMWSRIVSELRRDPFLPLDALLLQIADPFAEQMIVDAIRCRATGQELFFVWNFEWHQAEVLHLAEIRKIVNDSAVVIRQHCVVGWDSFDI